MSAKTTSGGIRPLILHSAGGFGKSSLLSHLLSSLSSVVVVWRQLTPLSSFNEMIISIVKELKYHFPILDALSDPPSFSDPPSLLKYKFPQYIWACGHQMSQSKNAKNSKLIIAIDDIDRVVDDVAWLPSSLPPSIRLIATISNPLFPQKSGVGYIKMEEMKGREVEAFTKLYLAKHAKQLNPPQLNLLLLSPLTRSPLFLRTILDEIKTTSTYETLTEDIQRYTSSKSIGDLFRSIIDNWEKTYSPPQKESFVRDILGVISVSKRGLEEGEIREILELDYSSYWSNFISNLKEIFAINHSLISFPHPLLLSAMEKGKMGENEKRKYRIAIARYFTNQPTSQRKYIEISHQLRHLIPSPDRSALNQLYNLLSFDLEATNQLYSSDKNGLIQYWDLIVKNRNLLNNIGGGEFSLVNFDRLFSIFPVDDVIHYATKTAKLLRTLGYFGFANQMVDDVYSYKEVDSAGGETMKLFGYVAVGIKIHLANYSSASSLLSSSLFSQEDTKYHTMKAMIEKKRSNYGEAKKSFDIALSLLSSSLSPSHPKLSSLLSLSADVDRKLGNYKSAEKKYKEVKEIAERSYGKQHPKVAEALNHLGLIAKKQSRYSDALSFYDQSRSIIILNYGESHITNGEIINNIGDVQRKKGNYNEAIDHYDRSLAIFEKYYGNDHPEVADVLNNIGVVNKKIGKYREAKSYFQRAIDIIDRSFGRRHYKFAVFLNNFADVHRKTGEYERAIEMYNTALEISKEVLGEEHIEVAEVYNSLGLIYKKQALYPLSIRFYELALSIIYKNFGTEHVKMGLYLNNLADVYRKQKNYEKAIKIYNKSLRVIQSTLGEGHSEMAEIYENKALVLIALHNFDEAKELLEKSYSILRREFGENHPKIGLCLCKFGLLEATLHHPSAALSSYSLSLKILISSLSPSHPEVGDVMVLVGDEQAKLRQIKQAINTYSQALKIAYESFGESHYKFQEISEKIISLGGKIPVFKVTEKPSKPSKAKPNSSSTIGSIAFASAIVFF